MEDIENLIFYRNEPQMAGASGISFAIVHKHTLLIGEKI
jgi:hypothetical protein